MCRLGCLLSLCLRLWLIWHHSVLLKRGEWWNMNPHNKGRVQCFCVFWASLEVSYFTSGYTVYLHKTTHIFTSASVLKCSFPNPSLDSDDDSSPPSYYSMSFRFEHDCGCDWATVTETAAYIRSSGGSPFNKMPIFENRKILKLHVF